MGHLKDCFRWRYEKLSQRRKVRESNLYHTKATLSICAVKGVILMATNTSELIEAIAADIGENVYIDIANWHLYLSDAHLHTVLAEKLYPLITSNSVEENKISQALQSIPVKIGGGKREIPLSDLLPNQALASLTEIVEKYQNQ
jgi:hypothetical protein